jgi:hypothetical protein
VAALCLCLWLTLAGRPARAEGARVDGVSDQSLPAWDGSFDGGPFGGLFRTYLAGGADPQVRLARYVLQWNALDEPSAGQNPHGDYRERFEAWLTDVRETGLTAVVGLTSYDGIYPASVAEYTRSLQQVLALAQGIGQPIAYVEPWNEPNDQGREPASKAAELANAANAVCVALTGCEVIAGDFEDTADLPDYQLAYERALTFTPGAWGIHPYASLAAHDDTRLVRMKAELPGHGRGAQIWVTEIAVFYCRHGELLGEARQAADAAYLVDHLLADPLVAPVHAFYYGLLFADRLPAPCARGGGDDSELYRPDDRPRAAGTVVFPQIDGAGSARFGPSPGAEALGGVSASLQ